MATGTRRANTLSSPQLLWLYGRSRLRAPGGCRRPSGGGCVSVSSATTPPPPPPPPRTWRRPPPLDRRRWPFLAPPAAAVLAGGAWAYCAGPWHLEVYVCICADVAWLLVFFEDAAFRFCDGLFRAHVQPDFAPAVE